MHSVRVLFRCFVLVNSYISLLFHIHIHISIEDHLVDMANIPLLTDNVTTDIL